MSPSALSRPFNGFWVLDLGCITCLTAHGWGCPCILRSPTCRWALGRGELQSAVTLDLVAALTRSETANTAADGALGVGIAAALPAAATGTADWRDLIGEERRIATVHALLNVAGLALNVASLAQRARGHRGAGRALSAAGLAISGTAAHLGGELSFGLGVRVNHTFADAQPSDFVAVADEADLHGADLKTVTVDGTSVLITRSQSGELCAIANTCSHLGGPLGGYATATSSSAHGTDPDLTCAAAR